MIFSFFKKKEVAKPERRMPERKSVQPKASGDSAPSVPSVLPPSSSKRPASAAVPGKTPYSPAPSVPERKGAALPDLEFAPSTRKAPVERPVAAPAAPSPAERKLVQSQPAPPLSLLISRPLGSDSDLPTELTISEFERNFTESSVMAIDLGQGPDPMQADIEQVAVLYANGQAAIARSLLDGFIEAYPPPAGLRFWQMYFDLLHVAGDRAAFDALGVEFAQRYEVSPPPWREKQAARKSPLADFEDFSLQGVLTVETAAQLSQLLALVIQKKPVRLDCALLISCDERVAGQLLAVLTRAKVLNVPLLVHGAATLMSHLSSRLHPGERSNQSSWKLYLELMQQLGSREAFEEQAILYATTFESSPPSWEGRAEVVEAPSFFAPPELDAYYFSGEICSSKFDDLPDLMLSAPGGILDFSRVTRMDFFSAGQFANQLAICVEQGKTVIVRSPNHLVLELMGVVGVPARARILLPHNA